jgi:hypothetical protein
MKMRVSRIEFQRLFVPALLTAICLLFCSVANAQSTASNQSAKNTTANATTANNNTANATTSTPTAATPVLTDYKGIRLGMSADEVRGKLSHLKDKDKSQDLFVFSDAESAQVFYDAQGKVTAISVFYQGDNSSAPKPEAILGEAIQAKPDGSMYELKRYPEAGYWVAYSRTAGKNPLITVTMNKLP